MAQDTQLVISEVGASWEQGSLLTEIDAVNFSTGKAKTFPQGSVVRLYKGNFTGDNSPIDFKSPKIDHVRPTGEVVDLWLLEVAPPTDRAWLVYTASEGLPSTYQKTWYGGGMADPAYKEGLTRLFVVPVGKGAPLDAAGFPAGLLNAEAVYAQQGNGGGDGGGNGDGGNGDGGNGDGNGGGNGDGKKGSGLWIALAALGAWALSRGG